MTTLAEKALRTLRTACAAAYPEEACGLLLGRGHAILEAVSCQNLAADPAHAFLIDPAFHLRLQREARGRGLAVLGSFHSHPDGVCAPSAEDARGLPQADLIHVICSTRPASAPKMRVFAWQGGQSGGAGARLVEQPLQILKAVA
jgi:proteasome lid subunit RPN8/RPN11